MALIKCKECGKEISGKAKACPHCGNPTENKPWEALKGGLKEMWLNECKECGRKINNWGICTHCNPPKEKPKASGAGCGKKLLLLLVLFIIVAGSQTTQKSNSPKVQVKNGNMKQVGTKKVMITTGKGSFLDYAYTYGEKNGQYAVTFSPFLPRNDATVLTAMISLINDIYGKRKVTNFVPQMVARKGKNLVLLEGIDFNYLFLFIKGDTGEMHSFLMWAENK